MKNKIVSESMQDIATAINDGLQELTGKKMGFCFVVFNAKPEAE